MPSSVLPNVFWEAVPSTFHETATSLSKTEGSITLLGKLPLAFRKTLFTGESLRRGKDRENLLNTRGGNLKRAREREREREREGGREGHIYIYIYIYIYI